MFVITIDSLKQSARLVIIRLDKKTLKSRKLSAKDPSGEFLW